MKPYIGVRLVKAEPCVNSEGLEGYSVEYRDGYKSWCPKEIFEDTYLLIDREDKITADVVSSFIRETDARQMDERTVCVMAETLTGFVDYQVSSCVDPRNYDHGLGTMLALDKIKDKLWGYLGFVLRWGMYGLKKE